MKLYEILVPTADNEGSAFLESHHHKWDEKITQMCGGLTILKKNLYKGKWHGSVGDFEATTQEEHFIPVRIACTESQLEQILAFTKLYYKQKAVAAYEVSPYFILYI